MTNQRETMPFDANRYQIAMEAVGVGMWDWDIVHDRHFWSKECKALLGLAPQAPVDFAYYRSLIHPDDREQVFSLFAHHYQDKTPHALEYRIIWPDGSVHWLADQGTFLFDEHGVAVRLVGVTWDITARKQAEEALAETNQQLERQRLFLQTIMQQIPCGMMIAEAPSGKMLAWNDEARALLEQPYLENRTYEEYARYEAFRPDGTFYRAEEYPLARAVLTGETIKQEVLLHRHQDGRLVFLSTNAAPISDAQGHRLAGVVIFQDVSERFALEQQKDEFICLASHALRTPLTSLKGNMQLIERTLHKYLSGEEGKLDPQEQWLLEKLARWNEQALRQIRVESHLIENLLSASSLQTSLPDLHLAPRNLVQVVRNVIEDMRTIASPGTLVLLTSAIPSTIPVCIDERRIEQVVVNYVQNALTYATKHQPVVIGLAQEEQVARVWVRDAGPGLSPEQQRTIWHRFGRAPGTGGYHCPGESGLGLGLYLCQELIHLHGGQTGVESTPGQGSTFWFTVPLDENLSVSSMLR